MTAEPYNAAVRALFAAPRHAGSISGAVQSACDSQGIQAVLQATVDRQYIDKLRFRILGCPHSIAVCEAICAELEGEDIIRLAEYSAAELMQSLAVPAAKSGRILALEDAFRQLGAALREALESEEQD